MIAVIADTHMPRGRRRLPGECLRRIGEADLLIHAGDFSARSIHDELARLGPPMVAVHGNVDDAELRELLPERRQFEIGGARIGLVHDAGPARERLARLRRQFPGADAVVFGHSHLPLYERDRDAGLAIFNPGSPTERRRAPEHTMGIATVAAAGRLRFRHVSV